MDSQKELEMFLAGFAKNKIPLIKQLITVRKLLKKSQGQISRDMGITPSAVCIIESGKRKGTLDTIQRYADAVGLNVVLVPRTSR
jgi:transcriptional regulator with XRE-family HTH domain